MILLTEEHVSECGQDIIDFLNSNESTKGLAFGELVTVLATAIFMIGQDSLDERL